eukprot:Skav235392  [mRNA]  locus=scaffold1262:478179:481154:- [translate_table: standard]
MRGAKKWGGGQTPPKRKRGRGVTGERQTSEAEQSKVAEKAKSKDISVAAGVSPEDIEGLIEEAQVAAKRKIQGSKENSHHEFHSRVTAILAKFFQGQSKTTFENVGEAIHDILMLCEPSTANRPATSTGTKELFPLPVPKCQNEPFPSSNFVSALVASLNSLNGQGMRGEDSPAALRVLKRLQLIVQDAEVLKMEIPMTSFDEYFMSKGVDYAGEEIKLARRISWEEIRHSLPGQVGQLDIRDFCEGGVLDYILRFKEYLVADEDLVVGRTPDVMVKDGDWYNVAKGLMDAQVCGAIPLSQVFHIRGRPLLSGMFSVTKQEFVGSTEVCRLIMNFKPLNVNCRQMTGDTGTLPAIHTMGALYLEKGELLSVSSEDIRCFFYLFKIPSTWWPYMAFGRRLPDELVPEGFPNEPAYLYSRVLPMGFVNSVGIAQHIHRLVVRKSLGSFPHGLGGESELRRDRTFSQHPELFRIYLDNFDLLEKMDHQLAELIKGTPPETIEHLRAAYAASGLPRHPSKAVERRLQAEVQGAWIDGVKGTCGAKPSKILKYVGLTLQLIAQGKASQHELQVVTGGLVYISMFRRPMLSGLNSVWQAITSLDDRPPRFRAILPVSVVKELVRFVGLVPLAFMDFRAEFGEAVTASDASTTGGGLCVSRGLSPYGKAASESTVRGDVPEEHDFCQVLSLGLFDGIAGLRIALDALNLPIAGHISVEMNESANRVVEAFFPDTITVADIQQIDDATVIGWALKFSNVGVIIIGSGPPCQGVSGLNCDKKGALRDARSVLFKEVPRVSALMRKHFPWAQVHNLTENVASMSAEDCQTMNEEFQEEPWYIDSAGVSLCHRPRLYWVSWELLPGEGVEVWTGSDGRLPLRGEVKLHATVTESLYLEAGWKRADDSPLPTFTTSRPSPVPLRRPAGLGGCAEHERERWHQDAHRFPPYQYKDVNCLHHRTLPPRVPSVREREAIMGFPAGFTTQCLKKSAHGSVAHTDFAG